MERHTIRRNLPRLITFDAFGTLFTPREPIAKQYSEVARQLGLSGFTERAVQSSFRTAFKEESRRHPDYGKASGMLASQWWAHVIHSTFTPLLAPSQTLPPSLVPTLITRFTTSAGYSLYPDVLPFFHLLREQRLLSTSTTPASSVLNFHTTFSQPPRPRSKTTVGIITNSDDRVPTILSNLGLSVSPLRHDHSSPSFTLSPHSAASSDQYDIAFTILSYDVGVEKPHRGIFDAARDLFMRTGFDAGDGEGVIEMVHVGDDMEKDVLGAREAGWGSVLLDREGKYEGDKRVGDGEGMVRRIAGLGELEGVLGLEVRAEC